MRRALATAAVATATALALTGCAGADEPSAGGDETAAASTSSEPSGESTDGASGTSTDEGDDSEGTVVEIAIHGDEVEPQGKSVEVAAGEPITLKVSADRAGELHVHSSPEQELEVEKGETTLSLTLDKPGIVDVEEHESGVVVLRLEVR